MIDVKSLREQFAALHTEAVKYAEDFKDKEETEEGKKEQEARFSKLDKFQKQLDEAEKLAKYSFENKAPEVKTAHVSDAQKAYEFAEGAEIKVGGPKVDPVKFSKELNNWANYGVQAMDRQYATITSATQSNVYLPREILAPVIPTAANSYRDGIAAQNMEAISNPQTPTTAAMKVPVPTGVAGGQVAENAGSETDGTPTLTDSFDFNAATYQSGSVYYSNLVLNAGAVDVQNGILPVLQYEKELGLESQITTTIKADSNITQTVVMSGITSAGFTFAKFQAFNRKLPKRFDVKKIILLSDTAYSAAEALVDTQGRPIMTPDVQNTELKRAWGTPVIRASYFDDFGSSKVVGAVISLIGFRLGDCDGTTLARYDQVPAKPNQVGFNLFAYHRYGYAPSAVALLECSAS